MHLLIYSRLQRGIENQSHQQNPSRAMGKGLRLIPLYTDLYSYINHVYSCLFIGQHCYRKKWECIPISKVCCWAFLSSKVRKRTPTFVSFASFDHFHGSLRGRLPGREIMKNQPAGSRLTSRLGCLLVVISVYLEGLLLSCLGPRLLTRIFQNPRVACRNTFQSQKLLYLMIVRISIVRSPNL